MCYAQLFVSLHSNNQKQKNKNHYGKSGKTTLAIHAIAEAQKAGGIAAFIDAEHAFDRFYAQKLGVDINNLYISQPDNGEQALEIAEQLIRSAAIANGGTPVKPMLIKNMSAPFGVSLPDRSSSEGKRMLQKDIADKLSEMMDYTVQNYYGKGSFSSTLDVCAKTGTAEISDGGQDAHAWVTGFTKDKNCPLAFAVIVENGNSGFRAAVPVASAVLNEAAKNYTE